MEREKNKKVVGNKTYGFQKRKAARNFFWFLLFHLIEYAREES
jgi:hypothetical protein